MKTCTKCGAEKPRSDYSNDKRKHDGLRPSCKECSQKYLKSHRATPEGKAAHLKASNEYYRKNRDAISANRKEFRNENPEHERKVRCRYVDRRRKNSLEWRARNKEHIAAYREKTKGAVADRMNVYRKNNPGKYNAIKARYRSAKIQATPKWSDLNAIKLFYVAASAEPGIHVDHIVPLVSKVVCGLHCEANLQLLSGLENQRKGNRFWPDMP